MNYFVSRVLPCSLNIGFLLFLYLPLTVYSFNLNSVSIEKSVIVQVGLLTGFFVSLCICVIAYLPKVGSTMITVCQITAFVIFGLILFPNRTGQLSGFGTFLTSSTIFLPFLKLIIFIALGSFLTLYRSGKLLPFNWFIFVVSLAISSYVVLFQHSVSDVSRGTNEEENIYFSELGYEKNIIVVVLDGFTGYRMAEVMREKPELKERLPGFVLYPRAIASALNTPAGISTMLTGDLEVAMNIQNWAERNTKSLSQSFLADAQEKGFEAAYLSALGLLEVNIPNYDESKFFPDHQTSFTESKHDYLSFWTVSLSRIVPSFIYRAIENASYRETESLSMGNMTDWQIRQTLGTGLGSVPIASKMAFNYFLDNLHVGEVPKKAIFFHSKISHPPYNFTESGGFRKAAGSNEVSYYSVHVLGNMLDKLQKLDSYDSSMIIVVSDHGGMDVADLTMGGAFPIGQHLDVKFNPLLMVKPPQTREPFRESQMSVWLGDVAATVRDFLGKPSLSPSLFATRSLLQAEEPERELEIPLFFRPDQETSHSALNGWARTNVRGKFEAYGPATHQSLESLFEGEWDVELFSGKDHLLTKDALKGFRAGGVQYEAVIQVNGRVFGKISTPGIIVISNASGKFKKQVFNEPTKGIAFLSDLSDEITVFAVGLHIPPDMLSNIFTIDEARSSGNKLNFAFARVNSKNVFKIGDGDVNFHYSNLTGIISTNDTVALDKIGPKLENPAFASVDGLNGVVKPKPGSVIPVTGASFWIVGFAIDNIRESPAAGVIIVVDDQTYIADYGGERPGIVTALKNPNYLKSQFHAYIPTDSLANGLHDVSLRVIAADRSGYFASEWSAKISIEKKD